MTLPTVISILGAFHKISRHSNKKMVNLIKYFLIWHIGLIWHQQSISKCIPSHLAPRSSLNMKQDISIYLCSDMILLWPWVKVKSDISRQWVNEFPLIWHQDRLSSLNIKQNIGICLCSDMVVPWPWVKVKSDISSQ